MKTAGPIDELVDCARKAARARLVVATSGNFSVRLAGDRLAISAAGTRLDELDAASLAIRSIETAPGGKGPGPSMEVGFHRAIYRARGEVGAVLHFQSPSATALTCAANPVFELDFIPEVPAYLGSISIVPFLHPGTPELAAAVGEAAAAGSGNLIVLLGHGQIALGEGPREALRNAEVFELACDVASRGAPLARYDAGTIAALRRYGR